MYPLTTIGNGFPVCKFAMPMYEAARRIWKVVAENAAPPLSIPELDIHKKILPFFQVGDCYYFIFNATRGEFDYVHPGITDILGYRAEDCSVAQIMSCIHPEDIGRFLDFEQQAVAFFEWLPIDKILKYKVRYDLRVRKADGQYLRMLHQTTPLQHGEDGAILRTFGVHTDITHLKSSGTPVLSFVGMDGEPSYLNVDIKKGFSPSHEVLTRREKQVLEFLLLGMSSRKIAEELSISRQTVDKHRKNMLQKTGIHSSAEMVVKALKEGWV